MRDFNIRIFFWIVNLCNYANAMAIVFDIKLLSNRLAFYDINIDK